MIAKTQERIENHFFEARKHVLEYDDVLNAQREHIYAMRREILLGKDVRQELRGHISSLMAEVVDNAWMIEEDGTRVYDYHVLMEDLSEIFPIIDYATVADLEKHQPGEDLIEYVQGLALQAYDKKIAETPEEDMQLIEQHVMLAAVNDNWMIHLQTVEYIREGINLRSYGQVDPLVAYKRETYDTFQMTLANIRSQAVRLIYKMEIRRPEPMEAEPMMLRMDDSAEAAAQGPTVGGGATATVTLPASVAAPSLDKVDWKKVGRNEPCPCGSGKKFKACHYPLLRAEGVI
jgi:preprotein translocase subunit SecA